MKASADFMGLSSRHETDATESCDPGPPMTLAGLPSGRRAAMRRCSGQTAAPAAGGGGDNRRLWC